jgi:hypothetical protein
MTRFITQRVVKRLSRGLPIVQVWTFAHLAALAGRHFGQLTPPERRRLLHLVRAGRGRPSRLGEREAAEVRGLVGKLEPRLFAGTAATRLSPIPLPKRVLFGRRGSRARQALAAQARA